VGLKDIISFEDLEFEFNLPPLVSYNKHIKITRNKTLRIDMYKGDFNKYQIKEDPEDTAIRGNLKVIEFRAPCSTVLVMRFVKKNNLVEKKLELIGDKKSIPPSAAANKGEYAKGRVRLKVNRQITTTNRKVGKTRTPGTTGRGNPPRNATVR